MSRRIDEVPDKVSFAVNLSRRGRPCSFIYGPYTIASSAKMMATKYNGRAETFELVPEGTKEKLAEAFEKGDWSIIDTLLGQLEG